MRDDGAAERVLVFAKPAVPGRVKTRLVPPLTAAEAAAVGEACLLDVVARAALKDVGLEIWYVDEPGAAEWFAERFEALPRRAQSGGDLGDRLADAFGRSFAAGAHRVVIMGADVPTVPAGVLARALFELKESAAVVGPSLDGGYYLVGLRAASWPSARVLFDDVPWSTAGVFSKTLRLAGEAGIDLGVLPEWYDVDRPADLLRVAADTPTGSHLAAWLGGLDPARLRGW